MNIIFDAEDDLGLGDHLNESIDFQGIIWIVGRVIQ